MLNLIDLEARWLRYKLRTFLPYVGLFIVTLGLLIALFYYLGLQSQSQTSKATAMVSEPKTEVKQDLTPEDKETQTLQTQVEEAPKALMTPVPTPAPAQLIEPEPTLQEPSQTSPAPKQTPTRVLKPSMEFMKQIKTPQTPSASTTDVYKNGSFESDTTTMSFEPTQNYEEEVVSLEEEPNYYEEEESKKIAIKRKDAQEDIEAVIKRFNKNNNPALSLFVAKKYYEMGDYHNAYNYALITNNINSQIESSWLIFAKSLVKLGKKEMAARTLQEYIQNSRSKSASILLDDILNGKFK